MSKVIIFGVNDFAKLAYYYLSNDSEHEVCAFCVDKDYIKEDFLFELPVVAFDNIVNIFPASDYLFFAPMNPEKMNKLREQVFNKIKLLGYEFINYISSKAICFTEFIGTNCFILEANVLQPYVKIGDNVMIWSGNHIGHHSIVGSHSFIASHVVISGHVSIGHNCFFGVNSTIANNVSIGEYAYIGASAFIGSNISAGQVVPGIRSSPSKVPSSRL